MDQKQVLNSQSMMADPINREELLSGITVDSDSGNTRSSVVDYKATGESPLKGPKDGEDDLFNAQYGARDEQYTRLLEICIRIYEEKCDHKSNYKAAFFSITVLVFFSLICFGMQIIHSLAQSGDIQINELIAIISSVATMISAILVLPKIIARHLFPEKEDEVLVEILKNMQLNDKGIRDKNRGTSPNIYRSPKKKRWCVTKGQQ